MEKMYIANYFKDLRSSATVLFAIQKKVSGKIAEVRGHIENNSAIPLKICPDDFISMQLLGHYLQKTVHMFENIGVLKTPHQHNDDLRIATNKTALRRRYLRKVSSSSTGKQSRNALALRGFAPSQVKVTDYHRKLRSHTSDKPQIVYSPERTSSSPGQPAKKGHCRICRKSIQVRNMSRHLRTIHKV